MAYEDTKERGTMAEELQRYIGDFYSAHSEGRAKDREAALKKVQNALFTGSTDSEPLKDYFNTAFQGRTVFNTLLSINDYPKESILRELLQNTFGCSYTSKDIKVILNFSTKTHQVSLSYNEVGFTMEQILYYLSFGRSEVDESKTREGRFGVGAKSVFLNVEWLSLKSNNFSFKIQNDNGNLKILDLDLFGTQFVGTEIVFKVRGEEFQQIMDNFLGLTDRKGDYMNLMELCFAFNRKKILDIRDTRKLVESNDRTFNIAVMTDGEMKTVYKIVQYQKEGDANPIIRFMQNGKSVIDFLCFESDGYSYLIPYAVASGKRAEIVKLLIQKYNYFSTYELTGLYKENNEAFRNEHLSAFFISVPNDYITHHRTGIRFDSEAEVTKHLQKDLLRMIDDYKQYFVLSMLPVQDRSGYYFLYPKSYAFEFFKNFIKTSKFGKEISAPFQNSISLIYPEEKLPTDYDQIKERGFCSNVEHVPQRDHANGTAYQKYITEALEDMHEKLADIDDRIIYVGYEWENEEGTATGREYLYEFLHGGSTFFVDSKVTPNRSDNSLYSGFTSVAEKMANNFLKDNIVHNDDELEKLLAMYDDIFHEDYKIVMKYYQFYISHGGEQQSYEVSKMDINNIENAMHAVQKRQHRFDTHQNYNEVVSMIINAFTQGKDTMTFLKEIKEQGGKVTLQLDINKRYRFCAYNKQFMIPPNISNSDMVELVGDIGTLIRCGLLNGREFDFPNTRARYSLDPQLLTKMFESEELPADVIEERAGMIRICDLHTDRIAVVGEDGKIINIIEIGEEITPAMREGAKKYIALRSDYTKPEFSDIAEYVITGKNEQRLSRHFLTAEEPNRVIPDQIPYYLKPMPVMSKQEFTYLRALCKGFSEFKESNNYRNYFAKDINGKLFGYGGCCPVCGFESRAVNSFRLKDFEVEVLTEDSEKTFRFSLYMCANDAEASAGWLISNISIGGMSPLRWLEEIRTADLIPPEFLFCHISYRSQYSNDILGGNSDTPGDVMFDADKGELDLIVSPLLAAKWCEDNK